MPEGRARTFGVEPGTGPERRRQSPGIPVSDVVASSVRNVPTSNVTLRGRRRRAISTILKTDSHHPADGLMNLGHVN